MESINVVVDDLKVNTMQSHDDDNDYAAILDVPSEENKKRSLSLIILVTFSNHPILLLKCESPSLE